jgi:hypothetical protein
LAGEPAARSASVTVRQVPMLKPVGSWKSGRVFSMLKIDPRTTTM